MKKESLLNKIESGKNNWVSLTFLICSFVVQIMTLSFGAELYWMTDLKTFIWGIVLGSVLLCALLCISGYVGQKMRIPTAPMFGNIFGQLGARIMNLILLPAGFIWVAWMSGIASDSVREVFPMIPGWIVIIVIVALSVFSAIKGVKGMEQSGYIQAPAVLVLVLVTVIIVLSKGFGLNTLSMQVNRSEESLSLLDSMIFVVLTWISVLPIHSDFTNFIEKPKDMVIGTVLSFGICNAIMMAAGGVFAMVSGPEFNMMDGFEGAGIPRSIVLVMVLLCTWTFNDRSFYSFGLAASVVVGDRVKPWIPLVIGGIGAAVIAITGIMDSLYAVLNILGCVYGPLLGVFLCRYYALNGMNTCTSDFSKMIHFDALPFIPWLIGLVLGMTIQSNGTMISFAISFAVYYVLYKLREKLKKNNSLHKR